MKDTTELNDGQLEKVTGGSVTMCGWEFYGHVGQYEAVVGENYYLVSIYRKAFVYGELKWSGQNGIFGKTSRVHKVDVKISGGDCTDFGEHDYYADEWSLYKSGKNVL